MAGRFEYVAYGEAAKKHQEYFKSVFELLEREVKERLDPGRASALVFTKLEEAYMWIGKQIRDDQISREAK